MTVFAGRTACRHASRTAASASAAVTVRRVCPASWACHSASVGARSNMRCVGTLLVGPYRRNSAAASGSMGAESAQRPQVPEVAGGVPVRPRGRLRRRECGENRYKQFSSGCVRIALKQVAPFRRPDDPVARGEQLEANRASVRRAQQHRQGVCSTAEGGFDGQPAVGARDSAGEGGVELGGHLFAAADGDEVDVFTQPSVGEVGAGQGGAADEVDAVTELAAEEREDVGDEVVALDLFGGHAELRCDRVAFVRIHDRPPPSLPPGAGRPSGVVRWRAGANGLDPLVRGGL